MSVVFVTDSFQTLYIHRDVLLVFRKNSQRLGEQYKKGIPIEVVPMAYTAIQRRIEDSYGGSVKIRMALAKAVSTPCILLPGTGHDYVNHVRSGLSAGSNYNR